MTNNYIPNTSSIPNIIFDYWMDKLSPAEFKVLLCIARKTYGWHKDFDLISTKQIEKMTGLHRSGIIKNVDRLVQIGLVNKIKSKTSDGDDAPNRYEINVYCVEGGSLQNRLGVVDCVDQGVVYSVDPQKKDYTKENLQENTSLKVPVEPNAAKAAEMKIPSSPKQRSEFPLQVHEVAQDMIDSLVRAKPDYLPPRNLSAMLTEVDFMLRLDKRDPQRIKDVFRWCVSDPFWSDKMYKPNPAKYLRPKFDEFDQKMKAKPYDPKKVDRRRKDKFGNPIVDDFKDNLF